MRDSAESGGRVLGSKLCKQPPVRQGMVTRGQQQTLGQAGGQGSR